MGILEILALIGIVVSAYAVPKVIAKLGSTLIKGLGTGVADVTHIKSNLINNYKIYEGNVKQIKKPNLGVTTSKHISLLTENIELENSNKILYTLTSDPKYVRELITGEIFPILYDDEEKLFSSDYSSKHTFLAASNRKGGFWAEKEANKETITEYLAIHSNKERFRDVIRENFNVGLIKTKIADEKHKIKNSRNDLDIKSSKNKISSLYDEMRKSRKRIFDNALNWEKETKVLN